MTATYLASRARFGIQLGRERMAALLEALGQPQQGIPVVQVAGTNGKGSVCVLVSEALRQAGYRVGRYTSPHLVRWQERIWVSGAEISLADWEVAIAQVQQAATTLAADLQPTQFEVVTAAAWVHFRQVGIEIAVLEVGLGGRLDATSVGIRLVVAAITAVGWDHWQRLGASLVAIASEKAGILQTGVPLVTTAQVPEVMTVLRQRSRQLECPLTVTVPITRLAGLPLGRWQGETYPLPLVGDHQLENGAIALGVLQQLRQQGWQISVAQVQQGFRAAQWPGRLQWVSWQGQRLLLDGAHNLPAAQALRQYLDRQDQGRKNQGRQDLGRKDQARKDQARQAPNPLRRKSSAGPTTWCLGLLTTKDAAGMLRVLLRPGDHLIALPVEGHAAFAPADLVAIAQDQCPQLTTQTCPSLAALAALLPTLAPDRLVLAGSLYLVGQVLANLATEST